MKIQIERKPTILETANCTFPIYAKIDDGDVVRFVKIRKDEFFQIVFDESSGVRDVRRFKTSNKIIPELWWNNRCSWREWQEVVKFTKRYLHEF